MYGAWKRCPCLSVGFPLKQDHRNALNGKFDKWLLERGGGGGDCSVELGRVPSYHHWSRLYNGGHQCWSVTNPRSEWREADGRRPLRDSQTCCWSPEGPH